jgi:hypothetical protein
MEGSRIGRIVAALGLSSFPDNGQVTLEALAATVAATKPADPAASSEGMPATGGGAHAARRTSSEASQEGVLPRFLQLPPSASVPERVSFSSLAAYGRCPRQFYLERMLGLDLAGDGGGQRRGGLRGRGFGETGAEEAGQDFVVESVLDADEAHSGRDVGVVVHRLLERLAVSAERPSVAAVREAAGETLSDLGVRLPLTEEERVVALTLAVWDSPVAVRLSLASAAREEPLFFALGGTVVSGIMDLVCREPECWLVTDYKTNALRGRSVAEVAEPYALQCALYGLAALRAGAPAVQMDLLFLESPEGLVTVQYGLDDIVRLERELIGTIAGLRQGNYPRQTGKECEQCSVATLCGNMVAD